MIFFIEAIVFIHGKSGKEILDSSRSHDSTDFTDRSKLFSVGLCGFKVSSFGLRRRAEDDVKSLISSILKI